MNYPIYWIIRYSKQKKQELYYPSRTMQKTKRLIWLASLLTVVLTGVDTSAQTVSQFDFNSTATISTATIGPNGTTYNSNSAVVGGVVHITVGCGHGFGLDMAVPGATFNTDNIQVITHFRRTGNEGVGNFFLRGNTFFGFRGRRLIAEFAYDDGGIPVTVSMPTDHFVSNAVYETYTFSYDNCTGIAQILAGNTVVGYFDGPDNRDLYWTGAGDGFISENVDNGCSAQFGMDWIMINGNTGGCLPLPVEFQDFSVQLDQGKTQLKWATASETNNDFFTVERSLDGVIFEPLSQVTAVGNSSTYQPYATTDKSPPIGQLYYRIKQTDLNGSSSYSEVRSLLHSPEEDWLTLYPNPSSGIVQLNLLTAETSGRTLALINSQGQLLFESSLAPGQHAYEESFDFSSFPPGVYLFRIHSPAQSCTKKLWLK